MIQPMVAVIFMTTMMSVYDMGFYGTCKYKPTDFAYSGPTFDVTTDGIGAGSLSSSLGQADGRVARFFYVNRNWEEYQ